MKAHDLHTPAATRDWTLLSLLLWSANHLESNGVEDARLNVELMLSRVLGLARVQLYTQFDRPLDARELSEFKQLYRRRLDREPLQYILGETEFMGLRLKVDCRALIPRPETEEVVERALAEIQQLSARHPVVLDIGTGTGNIPIALGSRLPHAVIHSMDVSEEALALAGENLARQALPNVSLHHADVFSEFLSAMMFDCIISNPPYISAEEFPTLQPEVRDHEPRIATTDNADGFTFIRRITDVAAKRLNAGGCLIMELGFGQADQARSVVEPGLSAKVDVYNDLGGIPRILVARGR